MRFRPWLEVTATADQVFQRVTAKDADLVQALGLPLNSKLQKINTGSFATIYQHPLNATKIIKATKDKQDIMRLVKAQALMNQNIVKLHAIQGKLFIQLGQLYVIVADKIEGESMPYTSNSFVMLLTGKLGAESTKKAAYKIAQPGLSPFRDKILAYHGRDNDEERVKLSTFFLTLAQLEQRGITMDDFTDNIIDAGDRYVIVDMGQ
jgi:hypothetical protein